MVGESSFLCQCFSLVCVAERAAEEFAAVLLVRRSPEGLIGSRHAHLKVISIIGTKLIIPTTTMPHIASYIVWCRRRFEDLRAPFC